MSSFDPFFLVLYRNKLIRESGEETCCDVHVDDNRHALLIKLWLFYASWK